MAPLVRRTWAPRGQTPILHQRTRSHQKVSAIAALCISPERDHVRLFFRLHPNINLKTPHMVGFLNQLRRQLKTPVLLVWDRFAPHKTLAVRRAASQRQPKIHLAFLPPYAPELNPIEQAWGYLKKNPLANLPLFDLETLHKTSRQQGRTLQKQQHLLRSFIRHSPLSLHLK